MFPATPIQTLGPPNKNSQNPAKTLYQSKNIHKMMDLRNLLSVLHK